MTLYLNHAGTSWPKPRAVREAVTAALNADPATWAENFARDHAAVARGLGLSSADRLLLTPGCTSALAVAIADLPWSAGDRVLTSSMEHHALVRPLRKLEALGVETVFIPRSDGGPFDLDVAREELERGGVRLVAVSAAANVTGERLPVPELAEAAHARGALLLVDGAQVTGWDDIALPTSGIDLFAFAGHKGPQAPWGIGGLHVAPAVRMACLEASCDLPKDAGGSMPSWCDVGSVDRLALAGLVAGMENRRHDSLTRVGAIAARVRSRLAEFPAVTLLPGSDLPTVAFTVDGRSPDSLKAVLAGRGVFVGAGLLCAPMAHQALGTSPEGAVRLSFGPEQTDQDADLAIEALQALLRPT